MSNSIFNLFKNNSTMPNQFGGANMIQRLNQFKQMFQGDPKQQVQQLLNSGQMTQSQYNQLSQMATQIQNMLMGK